MTPLPHEIPRPGPAADFGASLRAMLPVIETERLRLRAPELEDFDIYARIVAGPGGAFLIEAPSREAAWSDFMQMTATWLLRGHGAWMVERRDTGEAIGFVLIGFEPGDREPELGYMFLPDGQGKGFASEATSAARDYGFGPAGFDTLVSYIDTANSRSIALAERLGAFPDTPADWDDPDSVIYRHQRPA